MIRDQTHRVSNSHLSMKDWEAIILDWQNSDQSQRDYCQKNGLTIGSFGYWRTKTRHLNQGSNYKKETPKSAFSALEIIPNTKEKEELKKISNEKNFEIRLSNGILIKIPSTIEKELLSFVFSIGRR